MSKYFPTARYNGFGVNRADNTLAAELIRGICEDVRIRDCSRVETDLVSPRKQKIAHINTGAHTAANCQRDITLLSRAADNIKHGAAIFMGCFDIKET